MQPHADITGSYNWCNLSACRWPIERRQLSLRNRGDRKSRKLDYYYSHFPEKMQVTKMEPPADLSGSTDRVDVWNVGITNGANWGEERLNMFETVYGRIARSSATNSESVSSSSWPTATTAASPGMSSRLLVVDLDHP